MGGVISMKRSDGEIFVWWATRFLSVVEMTRALSHTTRS